MERPQVFETLDGDQILIDLDRVEAVVDDCEPDDVTLYMPNRAIRVKGSLAKVTELLGFTL